MARISAPPLTAHRQPLDPLARLSVATRYVNQAAEMLKRRDPAGRGTFGQAESELIALEIALERRGETDGNPLYDLVMEARAAVALMDRTERGTQLAALYPTARARYDRAVRLMTTRQTQEAA